MKNKRAWIRIIEALVAILLIAGFLILILDNQKSESKDISSKIYASENAILREIQSNQTYREYILTITDSVELNDFNSNLKNHIIQRIPTYLNCTAKICDFGSNPICDMNLGEKNIYARSIMIATDSITYNPKLVKLFCWTL